MRKIKFFLYYALSVHAFLLTGIAMILRILKLDISVIDLLAGTTMFVSGYGLVSLIIASRIEKSNLGPMNDDIKYGLTHFIMGIIGIWLIVSTSSIYSDVLLAIAILLLYARLMIPKGLNVPWILYKKSSISVKIRKTIIAAVIIFLYILLPSLSLLV